jgi:hypothetical protein
MPSLSQAQQRLFGAAEHGATFPLARKLRASMTHQQLHDFAATKRAGLPVHVPKKKRLADHLTELRGSGHFRKRGLAL